MNRALKSTGHQQAILESLGLDDIDMHPPTRRRPIRGARSRPTKPTVAQKMGLVQKAAGELSFAEWELVEDSAITRKLFTEPCPICINLHGKNQSVLTSCGHVFHKSCLAATKINQAEPKCPMCRSNYKERISKRGIKQARNNAARKIQSLVKSFLVRRRLLRNSDLPALSFLKAQRVQLRISEYSNKAVGEAQTMTKNSSVLIDQSDVALEHARAIFSQIKIDTLPDLYQKANSRAQPSSECSVCLCLLGTKPISLLSCSHVIHEKCRVQLEKFVDTASCPMCRQNYTFINSVAGSEGW